MNFICTTEAVSVCLKKGTTCFKSGGRREREDSGDMSRGQRRGISKQVHVQSERQTGRQTKRWMAGWKTVEERNRKF